MPDYGAKMADKAISDIEAKLRSTYGTAQRDLQKKLRDFNARFAAKDREKRQQLNDGKITKQEYADWKAGQVFQRGQWEEKVREVSRVMADTNEQAMRIVNDGRLDVFSENYNYMAYLGEKQTGVSFNIYNTQAVARLIQDDPQILPEWKIDEEKDYTWNYQKVNNIVQQGIIQGESIEATTKRLCTDLATQNENRMRMFARTAMTGAQNAGRQTQMEDAAAMGLEVHKQWLATMDSRTRDLHKDRDGEEVPYNEDFSGGLEYPGDPAGDPEDVYNCRCTMISVYPEHAAHHEGGPRLAYEDEDEDGHRESYLTTEDSKEYKAFSEKAYDRWKARKESQEKIVQPEGRPKATGEKKKRTPKKFDIDAATDVSSISKQMVKEGMIKSAGFMDLGLDEVKQVYRTYKDMITKFPMLKGQLGGLYVVRVGTNGMKEGTYANCQMQFGNVNLNHKYFGNMPLIKRTYESDVRSGWHPKGTDYRSILYHELGHALDGVLSREYGDGFSKRFLEMILNKDGEYNWRPYKEKDIESLVSRYAMKNEKEWFAESIATMMTADEKDKSSMQKLFEEQMNDFLRSTE